jgi:CDP-4-dehydro-6-deoxyglucose reductase, E3
MPTITHNNVPHELGANETVLDALLRDDVPVPHACRAGACQSCLMRATEGTPPASSQQGLKDSLKAQGYFLACQAKPTTDLTVADANDVLTRAPATVHHVDLIGPNVARVLLKCDAAFDYRPGQFIHLVRGDGLSRTYSLASQGPARDQHLELHVRRIPGGQMSTWLCDAAQPGDALEVRGPAGDCFYLPGRPDQSLLLAGTGTGLAPLYAIARDALHHRHTAPIRLYHGALDPAGLYLVDELQALAQAHANFTYIPCVLNGDNPSTLNPRVGALDTLICADLPTLANWRIYLCGHPDLVKTLRKKTFLAGAKIKEIHSDAFVPTAPN